MPLTAHIGFSRSLKDSFYAGAEAAQMAHRDSEQPTLGIIFMSPAFDQERVLAGVLSVFPDLCIVGGSSAGVITGTTGPVDTAIALMTLTLPSNHFFTALSKKMDHTSAYAAGAEIATTLKTNAKKSQQNLSSAMIFPDVLVGNGSDVVSGILSVLGDDFPVVGGAPGDDQKFEKTFEYHAGAVHTGRVTGIGFTKDVHLSVGVRHGWKPIGLPIKATKTDGATILEIDGAPALDVYKSYFGEENTALLQKRGSVSHARSILTYPLGIAGTEGDMIVRTPLIITPSGGLQCAAEVPEGSKLRLMIGSHDEAIKAAQTAATRCMEGLAPEKPRAIIIFNCIARKNLFGAQAHKEIEAIRQVCGEDVPLIGLYTYGEQAPIDGVSRHMKKCHNAFHNQTVVICGLA